MLSLLVNSRLIRRLVRMLSLLVNSRLIRRLVRMLSLLVMSAPSSLLWIMGWITGWMAGLLPGWSTSFVSSFTLGVGFPTGIPLQDSSLQLVVLQGIRCLLIDGILPEASCSFLRDYSSNPSDSECEQQTVGDEKDGILNDDAYFIKKRRMMERTFCGLSSFLFCQNIYRRMTKKRGRH